MFNGIESAPPDAILGLTEAFRNDTNPKKINLGVGVYKDDAGKTPVLPSVIEAERRILETADTKSYLPIGGSPEYGRVVQGLLFGASSERARTAHTPGGTGGLRVGADLIRQINPDTRVWLSTPTWANHRGIFSAAGFDTEAYPYYDPATRSLDFDAMKKTLSGVPAGDVVLLHVCCHNPTGVDPSMAQWDEIVSLAKERGWIPFLDFAYQGFGTDLESDRKPVEGFLAAGIEFFVASSFSKNFGLYQDRTGAFTTIAQSAEAADAAFSHVKATIRVNYSNPPAHGGKIVDTILGNPALRTQWEDELAAMRDRIRTTRSQLVAGLKTRGVDRDFSFIEKQRGMFSFSGLSDDQVAFLRQNKGIYIVKGGRINVAGITTGNIDYLCDSIAEALKQ